MQGSQLPGGAGGRSAPCQENFFNFSASLHLFGLLFWDKVSNTHLAILLNFWTIMGKNKQEVPTKLLFKNKIEKKLLPGQKK